MFYNKKYPENKDKVLLSDIDREDRIEEGFNNVSQKIDETSNEKDNKIEQLREELNGKVIDLNKQNGWTDVSGYGQLNATKVGDVVHLFGMVTGGDSDVIFTLPTELRPQYTYRSTVLVASGTSYCTIRPSGVVTVDGSSGRSNVSFSGVVYSLKR